MLIFCRKEFSISKITDNAFELFKIIDEKQLTLKELINLYGSESKDFVEEFINHLIKHEVIIFKKNSKKKHVFDITQKEFISSPQFVWWDITTKCNLKCKYCYSSSGFIDPNELTTNEVKNIIYQLNDLGIFYIFFLGGEPLLKKDFFDIIRLCDDLGITTMITTNGTLVTDDVARKLYKLNVGIIRISMDSCNEKIHNKMRGTEFSYKACLNALKNLSKFPFFNIGISTTISPINRFGIKRLVNIAKKYKCNHIQINPVTAIGRAGDGKSSLNERQVLKLSKILTSLNKKEKNIIVDAPEGVIKKINEIKVYEEGCNADIMGCTAGVNCLVIQADGKLGYCVLYRHILGDLKIESFENLWTNIQKSLQKSEKCVRCKYKEVCYGPCKMNENKCNCTDEKYKEV